MTIIRQVQILPAYLVREFDKPAIFNNQGRKIFLVVDAIIKPHLDLMREDVNKIGLILQYGYFKSNGRFFASNTYNKQDIKFASACLGIQAVDLKNYNENTRLLHKELILNLAGFKAFSASVEFVEDTVRSLVARQMNPRKILFSLIDLLKDNKIESADYSKLVSIISRYFASFEQDLLDKTRNSVSPELFDAIKELTVVDCTNNQRTLLTRLKYVRQTLRPHKIKENLHSFLIIKKLHPEVIKLLERIEISPEAIKYYAKWVIKAKLSQIKEINNNERKYLYLACFIAHQFKVMQDNLVDTLLQSMQQQINKARLRCNEAVIENVTERTRLTSSVLGQHNNLQKSVDLIVDVIYDEAMPDHIKLETIKSIFPNRQKHYSFELIYEQEVSDDSIESGKLYFYMADNKNLYYIARNKNATISRTQITAKDFTESKEMFNTIVTSISSKTKLSDIQIQAIFNITSKNGYNCLQDIELEDFKELARQVKEEENNIGFYLSLSDLSRKMQNRVADIVRYLDFVIYDPELDLQEALTFYQKNGNISGISAPVGFLNKVENETIYKNGFNISLYKAIFFSKVADGIKSGTISLKYSYRYMPIDSYLLDFADWIKNKEQILTRTGLQQFKDIDKVLEVLRTNLDGSFYEINENIALGRNKYVKIKIDKNGYSLSTPAVEKLEYKPISEMISAGHYVPILEMMGQINATSRFTDSFRHHKIKGSNKPPGESSFIASIFALASNIGLHKFSNSAIGVSYNNLVHTVNWYFSLDNLYEVNSVLTSYINKMWLPNKFKKEQELLHSSSDGQKRPVSVESLNANYSYKYLGHSKGSNVYIFIDERGILFFTRVFSSSDRDAAYVIDGLLHDNETFKSDMHSTDTHGYTEIIFGVSHLLGIYFAPRIKGVTDQTLVSFDKIKKNLIQKGHDTIMPNKCVNTQIIIENWDSILRLIATIRQGDYQASTILKRLESFIRQHPIKEALKEFGKIIKSTFVLQYVNDVELRQTIEKQLNKGELANKFSSAISFANDEILQSDQEDQEQAALCKIITQNIIILWNYIELTQIIIRSNEEEQQRILKMIVNSSILTWRHVNLFGTYNVKNISKKSQYANLGNEMFYHKVA